MGLRSEAMTFSRLRTKGLASEDQLSFGYRLTADLVPRRANGQSTGITQATSQLWTYVQNNPATYSSFVLCCVGKLLHAEQDEIRGWGKDLWERAKRKGGKGNPVEEKSEAVKCSGVQTQRSEMKSSHSFTQQILLLH